MTTRRNTRRRRYRKAADRRVWVFSELNDDVTAEHIAKVLTPAALEQARLEKEATAEHQGTETTVKADGGEAQL